jgi:hypothetical protein
MFLEKLPGLQKNLYSLSVHALVKSIERSVWVLRKPFEGGAGTVPLRRRGERSLKPSRL